MKKSHWLAVLLIVLIFAAQSVPAFALPDLKATANAVATYASGDAVWIPITVTRTGDPLTQSTYVSAKLCLSTDATWDAGDTLLWSSNDSTPDFAITVLNSTGVRTVSAPVTIPAVAPGVYYLIAFADPSNLHAESDETNNWTAYAVTISATSTQEWSYAIPAAEQEIPIGGFKSFYIPVSGAPSKAVISSIEAKFDYIASGGVESQLSARFNRAFDPGSAQGQVLVSQGSLAAAAPGTFGYLAYPTQFENAAVNANYFFRFSLGSAAPSAAAIRQVYVRITYILPAYDYRFAELVSRNSPTGWALSTDVGITGISTYPEYAWSSDGNGFSAYLPMNNFYNWGATTTFYDRRVTADYGLSPIQFNGATFSWRFTSPGGTVETRARVAAIRQVGLFDHFELLNGGANPVVAWSNRDTGIDYWRIRVYDPAYNLIWQTNLAYVGEEVTYAFNNFTFTPGMEYVIRIEARENAAPIEYISGTVPISPSNITLTNRSQVDIRYNTAATPATLDSDGDGVPDSFEIPNNLNPWVNDAQEDADSDGFSNLREYLSGSDPTFSRSTPAIMFDLDGDGDVDGSDLFILSSEMGRTDCAPATPCPTDFNEDGKVDQNDLGLFTSDYSRRTDTDGDGILDDGD
ncbi:MAG: hypothetical protein MUF20_13805, partial [Methylotetracoccus sp.]|nr:hypothetical protein [Methylotetracoccus sp.]